MHIEERSNAMNNVTVDHKVIGKGSPVFIIAEAGCNHNGDIALAKQLVDAAVKAGADAVKFQTFVTDKLVTRHAQKADYQKKNTGNGKESQSAMLKKLELSFDAFKTLKNYCDENDIIFLSTPFDYVSADFLGELKVPAFKIASGDITNLPFLTYIASMEKPVILSTGMSTLEEVYKAREALTEKQDTPLVLLHCTSEYPAPAEDVNLHAMRTLHHTFNVPVGLSDHTRGIEVALAAVALGATVIEKHITLDKELPGPDHRASLEPHELKDLVKSIRTIERALGDGIKKPSPSEAKTRLFARKSIVTAKRIKKGQLLSETNLTVKRPGNGVSPMEWKRVMGRKTLRDFDKDELIDMKQIT
jgi:N,N'-diacetyllegionaminate synthase